MNKSGTIGTAFETQVVRYLNFRGLHQVERRRLRGSDDRGDLAGIPGILLECKAGQAAETASDQQIDAWLEAAHLKAAAYGDHHVVLIVKRHRHGAPKSWAVVRTHLLCGTFTTRFYLEDWTTMLLAGCFDAPTDMPELHPA